MNGSARLRSFERVRVAIEDRSERGHTADLATSASRHLDAAGTGVSLNGEDQDGCIPSTVFASGLAEAAEALQATYGEGPAYTVQRSGRPVVMPDIVGQRTWVLYGHAVQQLGIRAVFSLPLMSASGPLGAISFYRRRPGELTAAEWDDAGTFAELTVELMTGVGALDQDLILLASEPAASEISQAIGMVGAQRRVDMPTSLALLRARAIGTGRTLHEVARSVLTGRLRLDDDR